ncbi:B12-binding domain-containing radical SAM protein [Patescibacteria group bacterium]
MKNQPIKKIVLIEPKESGWNVFSLFNIPRLGVPILGTILRDRGFKVRVFVEKIAPIDWNYIKHADLVGISVVSNTAYESYKLGQKIQDMGIPVVFGGPHATFETAEALQYGDYVLRGEGEEILVALIEALNGQRQLSSVPALSYWQDDKIKENTGQHFCQDINITPDYSLVHGFKEFYDKRWHFGFAPLEILTTRGCPYGCKFCSVIQMSGRKMRKRSIDGVVDEIENLIKTYRKNSVFFVDDNFTADRARAKELLQKIIDRQIDVKMSAQVRVETANDPELMELMQRAGVHMVQIGLESVNPETLKAYDKKQDLASMKKAIRVFADHNIFVFGMFVIGSDYDTPATVDATVKFAKELGLVAIQLLPLGPLPGTELTAELMQENRIITRDWTRYDGSHAMLFAKKMPPSELQRSLIRGYQEFYTLKRTLQYLGKRKGYYASINLYGFLVARYMQFVLKPYRRFLKAVEQGKYQKTKDGYRLIEPVQHDTEETPLDYPSQKFIYRLFGPRARTHAQFDYRQEFPQTRLQPVILSLPPDLKRTFKNFPEKLRAFMERSKRPVVIDLSRLKIQDSKFWYKMSEAIKPFGNRVRVQVATGTKELFRRLRLKSLQKLTLER